MADIRLIVADLDGTILGTRDDCQGYAPEFQRKLEQLSGIDGFRWAVNTGRNASSFKRVFQPLFRQGIHPDYVVVKHAYIFDIKEWGYVPHLLWNLQVYLSIVFTKLRAKFIIMNLTRVIRKRFRHSRHRRLGPFRVAFTFRRSEDMDSAYYLLRVLTRQYKNFIVSEYVGEIVLSTIPCTKGLAVAKLAKHLKIPREQILCIGDGHNDLSMLDGTAAAMTACPANATVEVMHSVRKSGGHIAGKPALAGVIEAIDAHASGTVSSELPEDILSLQESERTQKPRGHSAGHHKIDSNLLLDLVLAGVCGLTVLLAMASAKLLGPLSKYLMVPVEKAAAMAAKLAEDVF